ncbi:uncharacterized protein BJ171DRAFT_543282 [Polychytrium aggregatum]|uniref:uncharacterized protein n=1 Tax=Polychytrium aggregatum TaxID=110093 RepID=UPI0022FF25B2|nr:uncharacterized protein BJ171DRAFT_543282 [Polychytrium aggregatum]KAI9190635.1 hypothetical protein BJ171DRAFT_543282 [Polychytrium aggregatum]
MLWEKTAVLGTVSLVLSAQAAAAASFGLSVNTNPAPIAPSDPLQFTLTWSTSGAFDDATARSLSIYLVNAATGSRDYLLVSTPFPKTIVNGKITYFNLKTHEAFADGSYFVEACDATDCTGQSSQSPSPLSVQGSASRVVNFAALAGAGNSSASPSAAATSAAPETTQQTNSPAPTTQASPSASPSPPPPSPPPPPPPPPTRKSTDQPQSTTTTTTTTVTTTTTTTTAANPPPATTNPAQSTVIQTSLNPVTQNTQVIPAPASVVAPSIQPIVARPNTATVPVATPTGTITGTATTTDSGSHTGVIIGIVVAAICIPIVLTGSAYFLYRRRYAEQYKQTRTLSAQNMAYVGDDMYAPSPLPPPHGLPSPAGSYGEVPAVEGLRPTSPPLGRYHRVRIGRIPQRPDELPLQPGEVVQVTETYEDGWGMGINEGGLMGVVPLNFLEDQPL